MSKKNSFRSRLNIVLGLIAVFLLILGTNRIDKRHFEAAQTAVTSVYEDRVLAQDYIYKLSNLIHKKQLNFQNGSETVNNSINKEVQTLIDLFSETKLTINESKTFKDLKSDFESLKSKENSYYKSMKNIEFTDSTAPAAPTALYNELATLQSDLDNLALIQVGESKSVLSTAQKSLDMSNLMSSMEVYSLLVIGIIILVATFYRVGKSRVSE
ncbi:hypothetical protein LX97_00556 [Nonlabens dokdonensis]|uniref:Ribosomal protein L11 methyltransferase n=2 Tax=Nonlabens dokdonensis TaxID=328515 RepID=L7W6Q3_NONDD|nr:50S ribosomal protein L11 methyltransferase [Nonlabens dokdonensis]AGC75872.1 ribosomal protein L11 methyltransferase [Nonlabens dokdonensis DSW-6]PZX43555.1 hypothetical protein LX97_00556 [Nonlabens dokdonensis]